MSAPSNKALQLTANSAFHLRFGSLLALNLGGSATFGGAGVRRWAPSPLGGEIEAVETSVDDGNLREGLTINTLWPAS